MERQYSRAEAEVWRGKGCFSDAVEKVPDKLGRFGGKHGWGILGCCNGRSKGAEA